MLTLGSFSLHKLHTVETLAYSSCISYCSGGPLTTSGEGWIAFITHKSMVKLPMKQNMETWLQSAQT